MRDGIIDAVMGGLALVLWSVMLLPVAAIFLDMFVTSAHAMWYPLAISSLQLVLSLTAMLLGFTGAVLALWGWWFVSKVLVEDAKRAWRGDLDV